MKTIILPRQARDKRKRNSKKRTLPPSLPPCCPASGVVEANPPFDRTTVAAMYTHINATLCSADKDAAQRAEAAASAVPAEQPEATPVDAVEEEPPPEAAGAENDQFHIKPIICQDRLGTNRNEIQKKLVRFPFSGGILGGP